MFMVIGSEDLALGTRSASPSEYDLWLSLNVKKLNGTRSFQLSDMLVPFQLIVYFCEQYIIRTSSEAFIQFCNPVCFYLSLAK